MPEETNERAVSEMASVLTLVVLALVIVVAVGANVLFFESESTSVDAQFKFTYFSDASSLLITHGGGDTIDAGNLLIRGPSTQALWSDVNANMNESSPVGQGDAIQIGANNAYGEPVGSSQRVVIVYIDEATNSTSVLSRWNGTSV